ncbi:hypothetical protein GCM10010988_39040 [Cnuibacter physcomitrellae]|uniref:Uncharacterized protein n=1 Tax=Cnuibacter physcomitrellae TaxID=1619308 RepID=A0A1X9LR05_9MICO|nr:hypothetical protein [Cnuibacter physcomitrellae]ARJ07557.1 hypothetical protein B5808_19355 [Cnuibacter physcomitrellae]GGI42440.1 hypothetical protein GCM10010988_39040 [Cnuibacter physcomitrellae]
MPRKADEFDVATSIDIWKTIVGVQQHFNDIGWRIRSLAITALTFALGATFFGYLNAKSVNVGTWTFNPSVFVPVLGLSIWALFWFADGIWYHRLLRGAQKAAGPIEDALKAHGIDAGLSTAITEASHEKWFGREMNSTRKLNIFYGSGTGILLLVALGVFALTLNWEVVLGSVQPTGTPSPAP